MPLSPKSDSDQEQECSICYETPQFSTVTTKCGHTFCFDCYKQHVESGQNYSHKCPNCRKPISEVGENLVAREEYLQSLPPANVEESHADGYENDGITLAYILYQRLLTTRSAVSNSETMQNIGHALTEAGLPQNDLVSSDGFSDVPLEQALPPSDVNTNEFTFTIRTPGRGERRLTPRYHQYPRYDGPWTVRGHPDKRSRQWRAWERSRRWPAGTTGLISP